MHKKEIKDSNRIKDAQKFASAFFDRANRHFPFHNYAFLSENLQAAREIARSEGLDKDDYEIGMVAILLKDIGLPEHDDEQFDNERIIQQFKQEAELSPDENEKLDYYIDLLRKNRLPKNKIEEVLKDGADIHLAHPDAIERINLLRLEREQVSGKKYEDIDWLEICKRYYLTHTLYTTYSKQKFGPWRSKNFIEIERQIDKLKSQENKKNKVASHILESATLSNRETEDLFKIAFRNYVDLISVADRKAGLLIQVNSILSTVMIAFALRSIKTTPIFVIPTGIILLSALVTIFFAILASKPQQKPFSAKDFGNDYFFFGSFDRIDNEFKSTTWEEYETSMERLLNGDKKEIFMQITHETFQVRKVLAHKFGYLAIAYKAFVIGLSLAILSFIVVLIVVR